MDKNIKIKLISEKDILDASCFNIEETIKVIEEVLIEAKLGNVMLPDKISQVFNEITQERINCMPATLLKKKVCGVKWVSVFPENPHTYNLPNVSGVIILSEIEKGFPFAIMDGTFITAIRTACMGAIGAKYLAKKDSHIYGTIGTGEQAKMHFMAIKKLFPKIDICYVASRNAESEERFVYELGEKYSDVKFIKCNSDYRMASRYADIIVTAVSCQAPLLKEDSIKKEGTFYCHVGGWEDEYEVPLKADKIVCDNWDALKHRGSPTLAKLYQQGKIKDSDIYADIVDILDGTKIGRKDNKEFIYFNSIGISYIDVAVANSYYEKVVAKNLGRDWIL